VLINLRREGKVPERILDGSGAFAIRLFLDFANAIRVKTEPFADGEAGYRALELVIAIYNSCRKGDRVQLSVGSNQ
jgi:predicted dehydrogenase